MNAFLMASKKKMCLSCGDIAALASKADYDHLRHERPRKHSGFEIFASIHPRRFLRNKSLPVHSMDRTKSRSSSGLVNIDCTLVEIKKTLATFREQDVELRKRMRSLNDSIEDLASSRQSLASEDSNASEPLTFSVGEVCDKADQSIENKIKKVSESSFSSGVFDCIPAIAITSDMTREASDPTLCENDRESRGESI